MSGVLILSVLFLPTSSFLIHGARTVRICRLYMADILFQGHQGFLIPWLLLTTLSLLLQILTIITLLISLNLGLALTLILLLLVQFYSFLCVFSLRSLILHIF